MPACSFAYSVLPLYVQAGSENEEAGERDMFVVQAMQYMQFVLLLWDGKDARHRRGKTVKDRTSNIVGLLGTKSLAAALGWPCVATYIP